MKTIAFWENELCERGTSIALFDYAHFNETILHNKSIVIYRRSQSNDNESVIRKFASRFPLFAIDSISEVDPILESNSCDLLYVIKSGEYDGRISRKVKTVVHCVFNMFSPHGHVYAAVSPYVKRPPTVPAIVVPHMVHLPDHNRNLRERLGIPTEAVVYGRHGGYAQFDIPFVQKTVANVASKHPNIYFLFMNTRPFTENIPNILYLDKEIDLDKKVEFINTCDAMIWGRSDGETFGLSIAEFSIKNKPVFAMKIGEPAHVYLLGNKGIWYNTSNLYRMLATFSKQHAQTMDWNAFREYTPEKVMKTFNEVFIQ